MGGEGASRPAAGTGDWHVRGGGRAASGGDRSRSGLTVTALILARRDGADLGARGAAIRLDARATCTPLPAVGDPATPPQGPAHRRPRRRLAGKKKQRRACVASPAGLNEAGRGNTGPMKLLGKPLCSIRVGSLQTAPGDKVSADFLQSTTQ